MITLQVRLQIAKKKYSLLFLNFFYRTERHAFLSRLWLFFSPFLFPPKKRGVEETENELAKIVLKIYVFQFGQTF